MVHAKTNYSIILTLFSPYEDCSIVALAFLRRQSSVSSRIDRIHRDHYLCLPTCALSCAALCIYIAVLHIIACISIYLIFLCVCHACSFLIGGEGCWVCRVPKPGELCVGRRQGGRPCSSGSPRETDWGQAQGATRPSISF